MQDAGKGGGTGAIRRDARREIARLAALAREAEPSLALLRGLVAELVEADVPASLEVGRPAYRGEAVPATITLPPVHPGSGGRVPDWPVEGLATATYELEIEPARNRVVLQGPVDPAPDESTEPCDREDPAMHETYTIEAGAYGRPLAAFVEAVRELAIRREIEIETSRGARP